MRITTDSDQLDLTPGGSAEIAVDIINTSDLIEGVSARVIGLPAQHVKSYPSVLPLFPDSTGRMVLTLSLPTTFPAGRHPLSVEVTSRTESTGSSYADLDLVVPQNPGLQISAHPRMIRSRRTSRFVMTLTNQGNVALEVTLKAGDPESALAIRCRPAVLTVPAGATVEPIVEIKSRRMILGSDVDRTVTVVAAGVPRGGYVLLEPSHRQQTSMANGAAPPAVSGSSGVGTDVLPALPLTGMPVPGTALPDNPGHAGELEQELAALAEPSVSPPVESTVLLTVRHRPYLTRGLLTVLILLLILGLWAAIFLFGLNSVFTGDPLTKTPDASFFVASSQVAALDAAAADGKPAPPGVVGPPPYGAPAKGGKLPAGLGGSIGGTVTAASNGEPVARIMVEARRQDRTGQWVAVSSAASQADGSYEVAGLFPGTYVLSLTATGFQAAFAPGVPAVDAAAPIKVKAGEPTAGINAVVIGDPATINGKIDPGDSLSPVVSTVTVRPISGGGTGEPVATTQTDAGGNYAIPNLPAPFTYELSFTTDGYLPSALRTTVNGGSVRFQPTVLLGTDAGSVSGLVTDGIEGLGGVTVTTSVDGKDVTTGTPTTGTVGAFVLGALPTPATYVITFSAPGYADATVVVDLGPGQVLSNLTVPLVGGTGLVSGRLTDAAGNGLGGATVTVGGTENPPNTTTLTDGDVGAFSIAELPSPGSYTVTFTLSGYADQTVRVTLDSTGPAAALQVIMVSSLGRVNGQVVTSAGVPAVGIQVSATDGKRVWPSTTTSASGGQPRGGFIIADLPAGPYTVTATAATGQTVTALIQVTAGGIATSDFILPGGG